VPGNPVGTHQRRYEVKKLFSTRRRVVIVAMVAALVLSGSALAAWVIFTGASGTSNGIYSTPTSGAAITITADNANGTVCDPSGCSPKVKVTNNAGATVAILPGSSQPAGAVTFTTTPAECAAHMAPNPAYAGQNVSAGSSGLQVTLTNLVKVDSALPQTCASGSWTATYNLATTP
jgi:hypothetical protein